MSKYKVAYALSAVGLSLGLGAMASFQAWATPSGDLDLCSPMIDESQTSCFARNVEDLRYGLSNDKINYISVSGSVSVTEDLIIDITGKTIESLNSSVFAVSDDANFTINGNGKILGGYNIIDMGGKSLEINGGTFKTTRSGDYYGVFLRDGATFTLNDGVIDTTASSGAAVGGNNTTGDMNFVMNGGVLNSTYQTVFMPSQVKLEINDGVLNGGIYVKMGQITINGGTINGIKSSEGLDALEDYYDLNNGFAWLGDAIAVQGGSYNSANEQYGNSLNLAINGGTINANNGSAVLVWNAGKVEQEMNVTITGGSLLSTKENTEAVRIINDIHDVVANPRAGTGVVDNEINLVVSGGVYSTRPNDADMLDGDEIYKTEDGYVVANLDELGKQNLEYADDDKDGFYELMPIKIDMVENGVMISDANKNGVLNGQAIFESEFIADRNAYFEISTLGDDEIEILKIDQALGGKLVIPFDATLWDRYGEPIEGVDNTSIIIRLSLTQEQYDLLCGYDDVAVAYFNEYGNEVERLAVELKAEGDIYWAEFKTTHFSTYGIIGIDYEPEENGAVVAETSKTITPDTGTMTAAGASASIAAMAAAVTVGMLTSIVSFTYLMRRRG